MTDNRGRLDGLAQALLQHDTLGEDEILAAAGMPRGDRPVRSIAPPMTPEPTPVPVAVLSGARRS